jgi:cardiolipin synthase
VSKLNTLCQIIYLLLVVAARAGDFAPRIAITVLGALVFVTTIVSGLDYVITYSRKAIEVSRRRRGLA